MNEYVSKPIDVNLLAAALGDLTGARVQLHVPAADRAANREIHAEPDADAARALQYLLDEIGELQPPAPERC